MAATLCKTYIAPESAPDLCSKYSAPGDNTKFVGEVARQRLLPSLDIRVWAACYVIQQKMVHTPHSNTALFADVCTHAVNGTLLHHFVRVSALRDHLTHPELSALTHHLFQ